MIRKVSNRNAWRVYSGGRYLGTYKSRGAAKLRSELSELFRARR